MRKQSINNFDSCDKLDRALEYNKMIQIEKSNKKNENQA